MGVGVESYGRQTDQASSLLRAAAVFYLIILLDVVSYHIMNTIVLWKLVPNTT